MVKHIFANKKAISEIISYVLITVLVVAMASGVYIWAKTYAEKPLPSEGCPEISLVVDGCKYSQNSGSPIEPLKNYILELNISNRGRYSVTAIIVNLIKNGLVEKIGTYPENLEIVSGDLFVPDSKIIRKIKFEIEQITDREGTKIEIIPIKVTQEQDYLCEKIEIPISACSFEVGIGP
ncbi:MAG: hypothetical protein ABH817_02380 [archaeon]